MNNEHIDIIVEYGDRKGLHTGRLIYDYLRKVNTRIKMKEEFYLRYADVCITKEETDAVIADARKRIRSSERYIGKFKFTGKGETIFHFDEEDI